LEAQVAQYVIPRDLVPKLLQEILDKLKVSNWKARKLFLVAWTAATKRHDQYLATRLPPLEKHREELITIFTAAGVWEESAKALVDNYILNYV
jgi:hypothetical protein